MSYERTIRTVRDTLCAVFAEVDAWFDRPEELRRLAPATGGWSVDQVLEHVTLTNRFLLLTLGKWGAVAERRARRGDPIAGIESDLDRLLIIGQRGSFGWVRPEHMEPTGVPASADVRDTLRRQLGECLIQLERICGGIGALCRVTMTVNDIGKIDLYQWLFFLAQHARRHLAQLEALEAQFVPAPQRTQNGAIPLPGPTGT